MLHTLTSQVGLILLILVCALVIAKGGTAERLGGAMVAITWGGNLAVQAITGQVIPQASIMVSDALLATGFLVLAIRYASVWLGAGMIFQAAAFALHSFQLNQELGSNRLYMASVNVLSYCVLATVGGGAFMSWRKRRKAARARAEAEAGGLPHPV